VKRDIVVFFCNAGKDDGLGHLMRCLVLADTIHKINKSSIYFLSADPDRILENKIDSLGFNFIKLTKSLDLEDEDNFISKNKNSLAWIILDSKNITTKFVNWCSTKCKVLHFDDDKFRSFNSHIVVNNNLGVTHSDYKKNISSKLLIGPEFNTVDDSFFNLKNNSKSNQHILITLGGEDPEDVTSTLIKGLSRFLNNHPVIVVVGPANPNYENIKKIISRYAPNIDLVFSPSKMSDYMAGAKLAITAGGVTCYELVAARIPQAIVILEEHQRALAESLVNAQTACLIGTYKDLELNHNNKYLCSLFENSSLLNQMSIQAATLYSESGSLRIVEEMNLI
jgi:UDP-2,4-diacetamido-2,4,6-trideoxy-beta-L-altropyranose hydrolase